MKFSDAVEADACVKHFHNLYFLAFGRRVSNQVLQKPKSTEIPISWLVLPFSFGLSSTNLFRALSYEVPLCCPFKKVSISWSLADEHLVHKLRKVQRD